MTPPGVCFSRATPFVKRRGRHVHRSPPGPGHPLWTEPVVENAPFSALISSLRDAENFRSETARQLSVLFENEVKPRSCPDHPVSPVIGARQDIFSGKGGVLAIATHDTRVVEGRIPRPKSPITSPNPKSKSSISRPYNSTLIPRGNHMDRKTRDKPKTRPSTKNKPENIPEQEEDLENKFV